MKWIVLMIVMIAWNSFCRAGTTTVFPSPEYRAVMPGSFVLPEKVRCAELPEKAHWATYFREIFLKEVGAEFKKTNRTGVDFRFVRDTSLEAEGYCLRVRPEGIVVTAGGEPGFFYALQTLRQLAEKEEGRGVWECCEIRDAPRYRWRSFMLDSGRQYQQVATIKKYLDMMAALKMNYFHWHLTDGKGWRVEIRKYPRLTQVGAFVSQGPEQQGFYTQEQIREIVQYAASRYITIVPEIDMPGHSEAALIAYPHLECFGQVPELPERGFTHHIMCAGKAATLVFLKDVLEEVCRLFPSPYIHLGGDEAPKKNWDSCADCQAQIRQYKLRNSHDLQLWFSAQMASYLKSKGRKAVFWGDVVYQKGYPLPENVVVHWWNWRGHRDLALRSALRQGHEVICGTNYYTYLNFPLTPWNEYGKDRTFDIRDSYENNPSMNRDTSALVLGMSCALWADGGVREDMIDRRLFPRILAIAEQMWHRGDYLAFEQFYGKVKERKCWFERLGYTFGPGLRSEVPEDYKWD